MCAEQIGAGAGRRGGAGGGRYALAGGSGKQRRDEVDGKRREEKVQRNCEDDTEDDLHTYSILTHETLSATRRRRALRGGRVGRHSAEGGGRGRPWAESAASR